MPSSVGPPGLPPAHDPRALVWLLRHSVRRFRAPVATALREAGFGDLPQQGTWGLQVLATPGSSARDLVVRMDITKQAVGQLVDTLVGLGYVERLPYPDDRRRTLLSLTDRGQQAVAVIDRAVAGVESAMATRVGDEGVLDLARTLGALSDGAEEE
ncbi:MAG: MarR family winged helix-turn-helix transcriptional regulator [Acidimicrobiales bacterium]